MIAQQPGPVPTQQREVALGERQLSISISTFSLFPLPLRVALPLIRRAGLDGVELMAPTLAQPGHLRSMAEEVRHSGLSVQSVHQPLFGLGPLTPLAHRANTAVELAIAVGAPRVVLHSPAVPHWHHPEAVRWLEALGCLQERAASAGIVIGIENMDRNPTLAPPAVLGEVSALAEFAAERDLGITLDTCHAMRTGITGPSLLESYEIVRPRLVNVHLSDWRDIGAGERCYLLRTVRANHRLPGQGQAPLAAFLQRLASDAYAGPVTLELNPWALRPLSERLCLRILERAVTYIRRAEGQAELQA